MKHSVKNVTVSLETDVARWARLEAARRDTSVSKLLGELLKQHMLEQDEYENAMRQALARKPFIKGAKRYLTREELHERSRFR